MPLEDRPDMGRHGAIVRALVESQSRLRKAQAISHVGSWHIDLKTGTVWGSEEARRIFGLVPSEKPLTFAAAQEIVNPSDRPRLDSALARLLAGETESDLDLRITRANDGFVRFVLVKGERVADDHGDPVMVVGVVQDITERKLAEEALREKEMLQGQLRQAQKMESIGRLAGGVAHDLNNLLAPILGYTELLLSDQRLVSSRRKELEQVKKAAERAKDLTKQLLALGRKQVLSIATHDLRLIVSDFEPLLRRTIRDEISIVVTQSERSLMVSADSGQIQRVLMNLVVNAQDAITGTGVITIETKEETLGTSSAAVRAEAAESRFAVMAVSDSGCGMDQATQGRLFEPFFTTKGAGKGTGLGLSTAFGILRQHGGHITEYSQPGKGSTFRVYLPLRDESPCEAPAVEAAAEDTSAQGAQTVLVVEDDDGVRDLIVAMLSKLGYKALSAESSQKALDLVQQEGGRIGLVLTDVMMPGENGRNLFGRLKSSQPELKVLFMSGYTKDVVAQNGALEERADFISKPFSAGTLGRKLREVFGQC